MLADLSISWLIALATLIVALPAGAAEITVKGTTLEVRIVDVEKGGVKVETVYGSGVLTIPFEHIEAIESSQRFLVLHSGDQVASGRLLGVEEGVLLVGESPDDAQRVPFDAISLAQNEKEASETMAWLRRSLRHWTGNVGFGFDAKQSTTDTLTLVSTWRFERHRRPWRFLTDGRYFFDTEKQKGQDRSTLDNAINGRMRLEYDLFDSVFTFAGSTGEYDEVERLSFRGTPNAGLGYRLIDSERALLKVGIGGGWVYERFFGGDENDYVTAVFGFESRYELPFGTTFRADTAYLPAVDDWTNEYLIRSSASISAPLVDRLSLELGLTNEYDNAPAEDTDRNEFRTMVTLGWEL